jgi:hypothetical protein
MPSSAFFPFRERNPFRRSPNTLMLSAQSRLMRNCFGSLTSTRRATVAIAVWGLCGVIQFERSEQEWEERPLSDGPITVGIDGGYVRAAHKQGWFRTRFTG